MGLREVLKRAFSLFFVCIVALAAACGGSSSSSSTQATAVDCSLTQNQSSSACGPLLVSLTDATGDFVSYVVKVNQVTLVRSDGVTVQALPAPIEMDLAQLVDGNQLLASAYVPSGTYVSMSLTLDYSQADIEAEGSTGELVKLKPVDSSGSALGVTMVQVQLGTGSEIVVQQGVSTLASLDFDLAASNTVNLSATPPTVTVSPILYAAANPADLPTSTAMGKLTAVNIAAASYTIDVQPLFYLGSNTFGSLTVATSSSTAYLINGVASSGSTGLEALAALPLGTPALAYGTFSAPDGTFEAEQVYAGSSVPGATLDAVDGSVLARSGDVLSVRGVVYVQSTGDVLYHSLVTVTLGSKTVVYQAGDPGTALSLNDVSVGQRVALLGTLTNTDPAALALDAGSSNSGYVRLAPSVVSGVLASIGSGLINVNLSDINRHPVSWFDFSGTGATSADDADPANYSVATGSLDLTNLSVGAPVEVTGFVQPFGQAPPDFNAETVGNYTLSNARLMVNWRPNGSANPFSVFTTNQLQINLSDPNIGPVAVLRRGGDITDLTALPTSPLIVPPANGLGSYAIRQNGVVTVYVSFSSFIASLQTRLNGTTLVVGFFATGGYNSGTFTATRLAVQLK